MYRFNSFFPEGYVARPQQVEVLDRIDKAFETKKFVICCAPTGCGKSMIAKAIANSSKTVDPKFEALVRSYKAFQLSEGQYTYAPACNECETHGCVTLTATKQLQDQYEQSFADSMLLKGQSNYVCRVDENHAVDTAPCTYIKKLKRDCWKCDKCDYYNARNESIVSQFGVYNYKMYMCLPSHVARRQFMVCDEAGELEDELVKIYSVEIIAKQITSLLPHFRQMYDSDDISSVKRYICSLASNLYDLSKDLEEKISKAHGKVNKTDTSKLSQCKNIIGQVKTIIDFWDQCEYIAEDTKGGLMISPLRVDKLSKNLFDNAEKVLLMSATIIDPAHYAKSLGITDYEYIEVPSVFDPKHSPIRVASKHRLNRANIQSLMPTFRDTIKAICDSHKNDKGMIHTHNMDITNYMSANLVGSRFLCRERGIDNNNLLQQHMSSPEPTVLVSPSMTHGVDLKDDLARFQIIVKAPFLPLNSKRIKKLFDLDKHWYTLRMLTTVIQSAGRGTRSDTDHCVTYILDGNIAQSIIDNANILPKYFLERFV